MFSMKRVVVAALMATVSMSAMAQAQTVVSPVTVTPLPGAEVDRNQAAAPVQTASAADIETTHALDLSEYLRRAVGSVHVNDIQNNPLQPDINYRGFTASPLLGSAQGLSVYVDGVRLNQPFGDVVSWDLIPLAAIASMELAPGSNPLFGRNTLGGALVVRSKDGRDAPGLGLEAGYGSFERWQATAEVGGELESGLHWYGVLNRLREDGWRDYSPTEATQGFGKLGWANDATEIAVSSALAYNDLTGNGMQEQRFLERDRASVYTKPDNTKNQSAMVNLTASHRASETFTVSGDLFWRKIKTKTLNGDLNDETLTESVYQPSAAERAALAAAGYSGFPTAGETAANAPFPSWRCIANGLLNSEPGEKCNGLLNRGRVEQSEAGFSAQGVWNAPLAGRDNQLVFGGGFVSSDAQFNQSTQYGYLTPDRGVVGISGPGAFADGTQDSENADDARVDLSGQTTTLSAFASDRLALTPALALTLSARFDRTKVENVDALIPSGPGSLSGDHTFRRLNPAVSLVWTASDAVTAYAGYTEGSRAPSAIELGCADPENPCRLPNAMAGDPPLNQVVTKTFEAGARGKLAGWDWSAGVFRADNHDDILFVADDQASFGYFKNFGQTRRQGVELGVDGAVGPVRLSGHYTRLDATYETEEEVGGAGNSSNDAGPGFEGDIEIEPGDRIPLVPRNIFKAEAIWDVSEQISFNADMVAVSGVVARGNENGGHRPDGVYYLGPGETDAYAVFNLGAEYRPTDRAKVVLQVNNLFDTEYETAAQLGATGFTDTGAFIARPFSGPIVDGERPVRSATFYAPGAPRSVWMSLRYRF
jgi:outer membrane receptor protein involved in Fe transport